MENLSQEEFNKLNTEEKIKILHKGDLKLILESVKHDNFVKLVSLISTIVLTALILYNFYLDETVWALVLLLCLGFNIYSSSRVSEAREELKWKSRKMILTFENEFKDLVDDDIKKLHNMVRKKFGFKK